MNQAKFIEICGWVEEKLWLYCMNLTKEYGHLVSMNMLMTLRRDIQQELAKYSKSTGKLDYIEKRAVWVTQYLLRHCADYYKIWAMKELLKDKPNLIHQPQKLKGLTGQAWEKYVRNYSY